MTQWLETLRAWAAREALLIGGALLILVTALVAGLYFLEHLDSQLDMQQRHFADALALQTAENAREFVATGNLVSLSVIARQTAALKPVARVEILNASEQALASAGEGHGGPTVSRAIRMDDQSIAGSVQLELAAGPEAALRKQMGTGFVLVTLCLVALWTIGVLGRRRWMETRGNGQPRPATTDTQATLHANAKTDVSVSAGNGAVPQQNTAPPGAWLYLGIVNHDRMAERYTPGLLDDIIGAYQRLLEQVCSLYPAHQEQPLGRRARVAFNGTPQESTFSALCAGMLFLRLVRDLSEYRKRQGRTTVEFQLLVSTSDNDTESRALCAAGLEGRLHLRETDLRAQELDVRLLYRPELALQVQHANTTHELQPVDQLAQRYQRLISAQAEKLAGRTAQVSA